MNKLFTLVFLLFVLTSGHAQKFSVGAEYIPGFSNVTSPGPYFDRNEGFAFSHQLFLNVGVELNQRLTLIGGVGYMTTSELQSWLFPTAEFQEINSRLSYQHYVATTGIKYNFGQVYVRPEIGIGVTGDVRFRQRISHSDGNITVFHDKSPREIYRLTNTVIPVSFSFGHEITFNGLSMDLGVKGYYFLNKLKTGAALLPEHAYGFGFLLGFRI